MAMPPSPFTVPTLAVDVALAVLDAFFLSLGGYMALHVTLHPKEGGHRHLF